MAAASVSAGSSLSPLLVKRIQNELKLMRKDPHELIDILPDEKDIRTWYFLIRGPDDTDYKNGLYIGKLILSEGYPSTPVDFYMLTPNGRFEINKKICLTISSYHSDQWSPIWTIPKILGAFLSVMASDFDVGLSHIKLSPKERKAMAIQSESFNITNYSNIYKNFVRFIDYDESTDTFRTKTSEEILAEMPKPKIKKIKNPSAISGGASSHPDEFDFKFDISKIKLTE